MPDNNKFPILVIFGPTAVGKTEIAVRVCELLGGAEIIGADSMQIYRGMDVGTAKPTAAELRGVPHHMIDIRDIREPYSVADYTRDASLVIGQVAARGRLPVIVGGTGLYIDALLGYSAFEAPPADPALRERLSARWEAGREALFSELQRLDPATAGKLHVNDRRRVVRALEVFHLTGRPISEWAASSRVADGRYDEQMFCIQARDRAALYERIDRRVDMMMEQGLPGEVRALCAMGLREAPTAANAIGYRELIAALAGEGTLEQAVAAIKQATRNYAKRQMTWFAHHAGEGASRLIRDFSGPGEAERIAGAICAFAKRATANA